MDSIKSLLKKSIESALTKEIGALILLSLGYHFEVFSQAVNFLQTLAPSLLATLLLLSILAFLGLLCLLAWKHPRLKLDETLKVYYNPRTGIKYCTTCKSKGFESPLRETEKNYYICQVKECKTKIPKSAPCDNGYHFG